MPELPEVETTRQAVLDKITLYKTKIKNIEIRVDKLRWPIDKNLHNIIAGQKILACERRAKYLCLIVETGMLVIHLGMSGHLRWVIDTQPLKKHDHFDLELDNGWLLRYNDPRRFGALLWSNLSMQEYDLFAKLGPEPLSMRFNKNYWYACCQASTMPIKSLLMNQHKVVGVGNIYANEALFAAKIIPTKVANRLSLSECASLVKKVKNVLKIAIQQGGTTLKDFVSPKGTLGYFQQKLQVYGRGGLACNLCKNILEECLIGQRQSVFCSYCQH